MCKWRTTKPDATHPLIFARFYWPLNFTLRESKDHVTSLDFIPVGILSLKAGGKNGQTFEKDLLKLFMTEELFIVFKES